MKDIDKLLQVMFFSKVLCHGCGEYIIATDKIEYKSGWVFCNNCNAVHEIFNKMVWN